MSGTGIYHNPDFNLSQAYSYNLLIRIEETSFGYAVVKQRRLMTLALDCDLDELADPRELSDILKAGYNRTIIGLPASGFSLVPQPLFHDDHAANLAKYLDVKPKETVITQDLDHQNVIMFKTGDDLVSAVKGYDNDSKVYGYRGWIRSIAKSSPLNNNLYLDINKGKVHFLYFSLGILRFFNAFDVKSEEDLVYYTAFVAEELHLRPQHIALILSGDVEKDDANMSYLKKFYPNIELNGLQPIAIPADIPPHKYLALAALSLSSQPVVSH